MLYAFLLVGLVVGEVVSLVKIKNQKKRIRVLEDAAGISKKK